MADRAHVIFSGRVQGVWFRAFTQEQATAKGLNGWVKNCTDGTVEAVFEGDKQAILDVIQWLKSKHPYARVSDAKIDWSAAKNEFDTFSIRRTW